jgi:hypothetical protein
MKARRIAGHDERLDSRRRRVPLDLMNPVAARRRGINFGWVARLNVTTQQGRTGLHCAPWRLLTAVARSHWPGLVRVWALQRRSADRDRPDIVAFLDAALRVAAHIALAPRGAINSRLAAAFRPAAFFFAAFFLAAMAILRVCRAPTLLPLAVGRWTLGRRYLGPFPQIRSKSVTSATLTY